MENYKEMYLKMLQASEQAVDILITAQRECEEIYISQVDARFTVLSLETKKIDE